MLSSLLKFDVFLTVHHSIELFHQPTLMYNYALKLTDEIIENCALKLVDEIIENCALKLVDEIILYYDARSKKHQIT